MAKQSGLDRALASLTEQIKVLELAKEHLMKQQSRSDIVMPSVAARAARPRKTRRPRAVPQEQAS